MANFYWPSNIGKNSNDFVLNCFKGGENCRFLTYLYKKHKKEFLEKLFEPLKISFLKKRFIILSWLYLVWLVWNAYIVGGYSLKSVQENYSKIALLAEPIENRIFFAGEAFAKNGHIATMHGAMESGIEISENLIKNLWNAYNKF